MANVVQPQVDGPLRLEGEIEILASDGSLIKRCAETWLCRCGRSANKPFCDGSHSSTQFRDSVEIPSGYRPKAPETLAPGTQLTLILKANGPIRCSGPMAVQNTAGLIAWSGNQASLCRCGHSRTRPFCDGTHRDIRFEAD